jgi:hypothetical protein
MWASAADIAEVAGRCQGHIQMDELLRPEFAANFLAAFRSYILSYLRGALPLRLRAARDAV